MIDRSGGLSITYVLDTAIDSCIVTVSHLSIHWGVERLLFFTGNPVECMTPHSFIDRTRKPKFNQHSYMSKFLRHDLSPLGPIIWTLAWSNFYGITNFGRVLLDGHIVCGLNGCSRNRTVECFIREHFCVKRIRPCVMLPKQTSHWSMPLQHLATNKSRVIVRDTVSLTAYGPINQSSIEYLVYATTAFGRSLTANGQIHHSTITCTRAFVRFYTTDLPANDIPHYRSCKCNEPHYDT